MATDESVTAEGAGSLLDVLLLAARGKRAIAGSAAAGALAAAALALWLPPWYTATAVILPPQPQQPAAALLVGQLGPMAGMAGRELGLKSPSDLYIGILKSRTVADRLMARFGLRAAYHARSGAAARRKLAARSQFQAGRDSLIRISVEDRDRRRSAELANAYVEYLDASNSRLALTESSQRRLFFGRQVEAEQAALADAEAALRQTQQQTGVLQVSGQVDAIIRSIAQLRAEIAAREVALERLRLGATPQNPEVRRQQAELEALRGQLRGLEAGAAAGRPGEPLIVASRVPQAGLAYLRALRQVRYHESLLEALARQFEAARIDEAKEAPLVQVVDEAVVPELRSGPPRTLITLGGLALGAGCGFLLALFRGRMQDPAASQKLRALGRALWGPPGRGGS